MSAVAVHHVVTGPRGRARSSSCPTPSAPRTSMWDAQADELAEHFRVVRYDTRGHGGSPVPAGPLRHRRPRRRRRRPARHPRRREGARRRPLARRHDRHAARRPQPRARRPPRRAVHRRAARAVERAGTTAPRRCATHGQHGRGRGRRRALVHRRSTSRRTPTSRPRCEAIVAATPAEGYASCCEVIAAMDLRADLPPHHRADARDRRRRRPGHPAPAPRGDRRQRAGRPAARRARVGPPRQRRAARDHHPRDHRAPERSDRA